MMNRYDVMHRGKFQHFISSEIQSIMHNNDGLNIWTLCHNIEISRLYNEMFGNKVALPMQLKYE